MRCAILPFVSVLMSTPEGYKADPELPHLETELCVLQHCPLLFLPAPLGSVCSLSLEKCHPLILRG